MCFFFSQIDSGDALKSASGKADKAQQWLWRRVVVQSEGVTVKI